MIYVHNVKVLKNINKHTHNKCKSIWMLTGHIVLENSPHKPPFNFFYSFICLKYDTNNIWMNYLWTFLHGGGTRDNIYQYYLNLLVSRERG